MVVTKAKPLIFAVIGVLLLSFVIYNVEVGLYYFQYPDELVHYKMELTEIFSGSCSKASINEDLSAHKSSHCLSPIGTYHATDILVVGVGLISSISAPLMALKQAGRLRISRAMSKNLARLRFMFGLSLVSVGIADAIGLLTAEGEPLDWEGVFGLPMPSFVVELTLILLGISIIRKALRRLKSKSKQKFAEPWEMAGSGDFRGSLERSKKSSKKKKGVMTVGDLRSALSLDQYEDIFQLGTSAGDDMSVGRPCHYCNGQGCAQCDFQGEFF
ncbi:MAG: hypothetical protein QF544_03360 [Candidatus Thalassarchaeaceae archaeon]|nr:hypothetical protein [Candidatus Thalassarchaeaceae archaeon]